MCPSAEKTNSRKLHAKKSSLCIIRRPPRVWIDARYADNRKPGWSSHGPYCSSPHETYLEDALASVMSGRPGTCRTRLRLDCAAGYSPRTVSPPAGLFLRHSRGDIRLTLLRTRWRWTTGQV